MHVGTSVQPPRKMTNVRNYLIKTTTNEAQTPRLLSNYLIEFKKERTSVQPPRKMTNVQLRAAP